MRTLHEGKVGGAKVAGGRRLEVERERLLDEAAKMRPQSLTVRALARQVGCSPNVPMYVFGSLAGLHAAVAALGLAELHRRLKAAAGRSAGPDETAALRGVAAEYLAFGLEHGALWLTIHSPVLVNAIEEGSTGRWKGKRAQKRRARRGTWLQAESALAEAEDPLSSVRQLRATALDVFVTAARAIKEQASQDREELAYTVVTLIDGMLFQANYERVATEDRIDPMERAYLGRVNAMIDT
jgi:AcrR family transcriptional regulator